MLHQAARPRAALLGASCRAPPTLQLDRRPPAGDVVAGRHVAQRRRLLMRSGGRRTGSAARSGSPSAGCRSWAPCPRWWPAARAPRRGAGSSPAGRSCRDAADRRTARVTGALSTILPAYMTSTSSATSATTPRSWVMRSMAMPRRCCRSCSRSRICAWMVTSSAVVGSSAISSCRIAGERHGDHDALAHAARDAVRDSRRGASRPRGCARARASRSRAFARRLAATALRVREDAPRRSAGPTVCTGLSEVIGSWKIIDISLPRMRRRSSARQAQQVAALEQHRAGLDAAGRRSAPAP